MSARPSADKEIALCEQPSRKGNRLRQSIEQYRRGFATIDVEAFKAIWDQDHENIIYIAAELTHRR